jgi:hypothetical protein
MKRLAMYVSRFPPTVPKRVAQPVGDTAAAGAQGSALVHCDCGANRDLQKGSIPVALRTLPSLA